MPQVLAVCGWEKHQHYKDRDPPWIKLYRDLLTSESWVLGTDTSRVVQVACILLAARYHNATPFNFSLFRKVASLDLSEREFNASLEHLTRYQFLEIQGENLIAESSASKTLATCTSEAEQSREETEGAKAPRASKRAPPEFEPDRDYALREISDIDIDREVQKFRDWEFKTPRKDWPAVWRTWIGNARDRKQYAKKPSGINPKEWR